MTVQELIEALQKVENKQLPVVFTDTGYGEVLVDFVEVDTIEKGFGLVEIPSETVEVVMLDGEGFNG